MCQAVHYSALAFGVYDMVQLLVVLNAMTLQDRLFADRANRFVVTVSQRIVQARF